MEIHKYLQIRLPLVSIACQHYKVKKLYAFGSIVDGRFIEGTSDIDLLVELEEKDEFIRANNLLNLWLDLQLVLNCQVDLISKECIRGKYFKKYLMLYKVLIFDSQ